MLQLQTIRTIHVPSPVRYYIHTIPIPIRVDISTNKDRTVNVDISAQRSSYLKPTYMDLLFHADYEYIYQNPGRPAVLEKNSKRCNVIVTSRAPVVRVKLEFIRPNNIFEFIFEQFRESKEHKIK